MKCPSDGMVGTITKGKREKREKWDKDNPLSPP
jgi:hypothetical protein